MVGIFINFASPILQANIIGLLSSSFFETAFYVAVALIFVRILAYIVKYLSNLIYVKISCNVKVDLKNSLITAITAVTMTKNDATNTGLYIDRINDDVGKCSDVLLDLMSAFFNLLSNIGFLIYIAFLNIYFFFALLAYTVVLWIIDENKERRWFKDRKITKKLHEISNLIEEEIQEE